MFGLSSCGAMKLMVSLYVKRATWSRARDQFNAECELIFQIMSVNKCYMAIQE